MTAGPTERESSMSDHEHQAEAALAALDASGLKAVRLLYPDLHGVARGKDIPLRHFPGMAGEGVTFCGAVMGTDLRHTPVVGGEEGYVDLAIRPDLATLRVVPWQPEVAWCLGEAWTLDGEAHWPVCPRNLLRRAVDAYAERGLEPIVAPELEFFLLERDPSSSGGLRRYVDELSRVYTVGAVSDPREVVLRMLLWCDELGLEAFAANHEYMNSQYEINVKHSGALDAADRAFMLKAAVKEIAVREGLLATFMGRPFSDQGGSGFHLHRSLNGEEGDNAFADDTRPDGLSPLAASFVAGVLEHARGLQALLGPTINAYKRILPDSLAPTHANWGHDNRTAFCRIPKERGSRARVEVRTGDGSANAHLITAAILFAGLHGIERGLEPPEPVVGDAYRMDEAHAGTTLPHDLGAALDALEADTWLVEQLGPQLVSTFVAMKRFEVERFQEVVGELDRDVITVWEVEEYAAHL
jgi:glutamine synthetase